MHLIISDADGRRTEAMVLAVSTERMRISIPGAEDIIELRVQRNRWIAENGEPVEIEAVLSESDLSSQFAEFRPIARATAGGRVS